MIEACLWIQLLMAQPVIIVRYVPPEFHWLVEEDYDDERDV